MSSQPMSAIEIGPIIRRNFLLAFLSIGLGTVLGFWALKQVNPKFKAKCVLNIQASYFQNALLGNILYQSYDPAEQSAQRNSLLRMAINEDFLEKLGQKYKLFKFAAEDPRHNAERADLGKRIEYYSINSAAYQINTIAGDAKLAFTLLEDVLEQMITTLLDERRRTLLTMREALEARIKELTPPVEAGLSSPASGQELENLRNDLLKIQAQIAIFKSQYTERHPEVLRLQERERLLKAMLKEPNKGNEKIVTEPVVAPSSLNPATKGAQQELLDELTKKLNYLGVVLDTEQKRENIRFLSVVEKPALPAAPFYPVREVFLMVGFVAGLVLAAVLITYRELARGTFLAPEAVASTLGTVLLGELPELAGRGKLQLSQAPGADAVRQYLPGPSREE